MNDNRMPIIEIALDWIPETEEIFPDGAPLDWTSDDVIALIEAEVKAKGVRRWLDDWGLSGYLEVHVGGIRVTS